MLNMIQKQASPTDGVKHAIQHVTPEIARDWLDSNYDKQRNLRKRAVNRYTEDMKNGAWMFDGAPIRFDESANLIDGQHRLNALINSGLTLPFLIVTGLSEETFMVMDTGPRRDSRDILTIEGSGQVKNELSRLLPFGYCYRLWQAYL